MPHRLPPQDSHASAPPTPPPPPSGDDWSRAEMWVMNTLQSLVQETRETRDTLTAINVRLENHSTRLGFIASGWGLIGGILAGVVTALLVAWLQHTK